MLTAEQINLPEEVFEALKGKVFRTRVTRKVTFGVQTGQVFNYHPTTGRRIAPFSGPKVFAKLGLPVSEKIGEYGLNAIHAIIHEHNFVYQGQAETGEFIFFKEEVNFILNGQTYHVPSAMKILRVNGSVAEIEDVIDPSSYTFTYTVNRVKQTVTFSDEEVAAMLNMSVEDFNEAVYTKWIADSPDPLNNITSTFAIVTNSPNGYFTDLYVNEELIGPANYGTRFTHYGKKTGVKLNYVMYNSCTPATADASAGYEAGNFGACAKSNNHDWATPIDFPFDLEKEYAVLEARVCEQPETGKEYRTHGYFDIKTNQPIPRLHRKTGEGVIFI